MRYIPRMGAEGRQQWGNVMRLIAAVAALILLGQSMPAMAAQGEVCHADAAPMPAPFDNDVVFHCKSAGDLTIPQLYEKGWRVVQAQTIVPPAQDLVQGKVQWTILVEKL